jgi:monovalent cation:H+ antiporter-2, CPA2 family
VALARRVRYEYAMATEQDEAACPHVAKVDRHIKPHTKGCEECLAMGDSWVHLRLCMACGHVGCCDDSKNKHATKHFHQTKHPIMRSLEPGEHWGWCFVDEVGFDPF